MQSRRAGSEERVVRRHDPPGRCSRGSLQSRPPLPPASPRWPGRRRSPGRTLLTSTQPTGRHSPGCSCSPSPNTPQRTKQRRRGEHTRFANLAGRRVRISQPSRGRLAPPAAALAESLARPHPAAGLPSPTRRRHPPHRHTPTPRATPSRPSSTSPPPATTLTAATSPSTTSATTRARASSRRPRRASHTHRD